MPFTKIVSPAELVKRIDDSKVPLGEEETRYLAIREKVLTGKPLSAIEQNVLLVVAKKADQWERGVEDSSETDPAQTLPGC